MGELLQISVPVWFPLWTPLKTHRSEVVVSPLCIIVLHYFYYITYHALIQMFTYMNFNSEYIKFWGSLTPFRFWKFSYDTYATDFFFLHSIIWGQRSLNPNCGYQIEKPYKIYVYWEYILFFTISHFVFTLTRWNICWMWED